MSFDRKDAKTRRAFSLCVFASLRSVVLLCFVGGAVFAEWPTYHGNSGLTGLSDVPLPDQPILLWRYNATLAVDNTPVSDEERIYFSTRKGLIAAIDLNGSNVWKQTFTRTNDAGQEMPIRFDAPPAVFDGIVFAGSSRGILYALDAAKGEERWRYDTGGSILGSPNKSNGSVVVLDQSEGALHAVDMKTGKCLWKTDGVERCDGSPGCANGRIVFGSCLSSLHVYSTGGSHLKDIEIGGDSQIAGGVAVDGNFAFAGTRDGSLLCAELQTGDVAWYSHESEDQTFSTPALAADRVVYSSDDGFVYAVTRETGELIWKFDTGGLPYSPVIANDKIAVSADGILFLLSLTDGSLLWSKEISDEITSPALVGGMILVGADDGTVSAFGLKK